jgi:hypothetical protein
MRKFLSLLFAVLLCASAGFAQTVQNRWPEVIGVRTSTSPSVLSTYALNLADTWGAYSWFPEANKTVSKVRVYAAMTGTVTDIECDIYSDTAGTPNASLSHVHKTTGLTTGVQEFTGLSQAVTSHTLYWVVIVNNSGTPASNYPTLNFVYGLGWFPTGGATWGNSARKATTGPAWGSATQEIGGFEVEYSDGSVDGWLTISAGVSATKIYNSGAAQVEYAASFTTPANSSLKVRGVGFFARKYATPPSGLKFAIYPSTGHTVVTGGTTATIPAANVATSAYSLVAYLPATITLTGGTVYKVSMIYDGTDGDTTNYYASVKFTIPTDAQSPTTRALGPLGGTISMTTWDGSNWAAATLTEIPVFVLILDTDGPFPTVTGGGGTGRVVNQ